MVGSRGIAVLLVALVWLVAPAYAQYQAPSERLELNGKSAATWSDGTASVIQLDGAVSIELDRAKLSASQAVVWITPVSQQNLDLQDVRIALLGGAKIEQQGISRTGETLFATAQLRGDKIHITADERVARDQSDSPTYKQAAAIRAAQGPSAVEPSAPPSGVLTPGGSNATALAATTRPKATANAKPGTGSNEPVRFSFTNLETTQTDDGTVAAVLTGGVVLSQQRPTGEYLELQADHVVVFTSLKSLKELTEPEQRNKRMQETVLGAYLEGDVRINFSPSKPGMGEQRMTGDRVYYDFTTDRAVLTNAVVHTQDPRRQTPMVARAKLMRQLSVGEYKADNVELTTSSFALPSYSIAADRMYVVQEPGDNPQAGNKVAFQAQGVTFQAFDVPFFWLPFASGSLERGEPLRGLGFGNAHAFGFEAMTEWGLPETLGLLPSRDFDADYRLDYFSQRGPGIGLNAAYGGGFLTDTTKQPWDFEGTLKSYFVYDKGADDLGRLPVRANAGEDLRGAALWEHEHFFPDNWLAKVRLGWVSDATFMEEWFRKDFEEGPPHDAMVYLKHQDQTEAFTIGAQYQPNRLVTTSNQQQEQFEVERLPELSYRRIGDSIAGDKLTFFSENSGGGLRFEESRSPLKAQGFSLPTVSPGLAALGATGLSKNITWRGDTRQEIDFPFTAGPFRVMPYVFGRYTQYSDSPTNSEVARLFAGAGTRITTQIWKTDPAAHSELFDIHQVRHVIEPEVNLFTSATNVDNSRVFIYDEPVDKINDVSAAQIALHQRWQTKRGGPGEWRSVDFFTFDVDVDFFANKPPKALREPYNFRGLFFPSNPEASVPRNAINANASWHISDNTIVLADSSYNLDKMEVQTIALGVLIRRDTRLSTYIGNRYIADLDSNITSISVNYEMTTKYTAAFDQEFDFTQGHNVYSSVSLIRKFDTFYIAGRYYFDEITGENGFSFNLYPIGLGTGVDTGSFQTFRR